MTIETKAIGEKGNYTGSALKVIVVKKDDWYDTMVAKNCILRHTGEYDSEGGAILAYISEIDGCSYEYEI